MTLKRDAFLRFGGSTRIYKVTEAQETKTEPAPNPAPAATRKRSSGFISGGSLDTTETVVAGPRLSIESHWEKSAGALGDSSKSEKFMKLLGARKKPKS